MKTKMFNEWNLFEKNKKKIGIFVYYGVEYDYASKNY